MRAATTPPVSVRIKSMSCINPSTSIVKPAPQFGRRVAMEEEIRISHKSPTIVRSAWTYHEAWYRRRRPAPPVDTPQPRPAPRRQGEGFGERPYYRLEYRHGLRLSRPEAL